MADKQGLIVHETLVPQQQLTALSCTIPAREATNTAQSSRQNMWPRFDCICMQVVGDRYPDMKKFSYHYRSRALNASEL